MKAEQAFEAFEAEYGQAVATETLERIGDAHWNGGKGEGVTFWDINQHNACNHTMSGTIEVQGKTFGFIIESGDRNGTVIKGWGDPDDVGTFEPIKPTMYTFVPRDSDLKEKRPEMYGVYLLWRKEPWFKEKERALNYDRHFAPGLKTDEYYRTWAESKGLRISIVGDDE